MSRQLASAFVALMTIAVGLTAFCPMASAQHSDIGVYRNADQRIVTVGAGGTVQRAFLRSFDFFGHPFGNPALPTVYSGDDPGFVAGSAPTGLDELPGSVEVSIEFLPFDFGSGLGNLFHWDGMGVVDFGAVPNNHSLYITDGNNAETSLDGFPLAVDGGLVSVTDEQGGIHDHIQFRLDDNDNRESTEPRRGIYLFSAQLGVNGLTSSHPFAIGLSSPDVPRSVEDQAVAWIETSIESFRFGSLLGDFDRNGQLDLGDIDGLVHGIATQSNDLSFDLTMDGQVTIDDLDQWRELAGESILGTDRAIANGDINLDGNVNGADLDLWSVNRFTFTAAWSAGDFNADGFVDGSDFNLWNANRLVASAATASSVPEPKGVLLVHFVFPFMSVLRKEQPA